MELERHRLRLAERQPPLLVLQSLHLPPKLAELRWPAQDAWASWPRCHRELRDVREVLVRQQEAQLELVRRDVRE